MLRAARPNVVCALFDTFRLSFFSSAFLFPGRIRKSARRYRCWAVSAPTNGAAQCTIASTAPPADVHTMTSRTRYSFILLLLLSLPNYSRSRLHCPAGGPNLGWTGTRHHHRHLATVNGDRGRVVGAGAGAGADGPTGKTGKGKVYGDGNGYDHQVFHSHDQAPPWHTAAHKPSALRRPGSTTPRWTRKVLFNLGSNTVNYTWHQDDYKRSEGSYDVCACVCVLLHVYLNVHIGVQHRNSSAIVCSTAKIGVRSFVCFLG